MCFCLITYMEKNNNTTSSDSRLGDKSDQEGHRNTNQCHQNVSREGELLNGCGLGGRGSGSRGTGTGAGGRVGGVDGASVDTLQTGQNTLTAGTRVVGDNCRDGGRACQVKVPFYQQGPKGEYWEDKKVKVPGGGWVCTQWL
jgi:hypothetical protein